VLDGLRVKHRIFAAAVALLAVAVVQTASGKAGWLNNLDQAQKEAKTGNKLVFINFTGSDWCGYCMAMEKSVFSRAEFKEYARKNLVLVDIDFPRGRRLTMTQKKHNEELANRYGVRGFPTYIVLDQDGKQLAKLGFTEGGPKEFIAELEKLRTNPSGS
jgi:protein disulfide-isomerase